MTGYTPQPPRAGNHHGRRDRLRAHRWRIHAGDWGEVQRPYAGGFWRREGRIRVVAPAIRIQHIARVRRARQGSRTAWELVGEVERDGGGAGALAWRGVRQEVCLSVRRAAHVSLTSGVYLAVFVAGLFRRERKGEPAILMRHGPPLVAWWDSAYRAAIIGGQAPLQTA